MNFRIDDNRHIRSFDLKGIEEDYPRFNHASDCMDYAIFSMLKGDDYGVRQPSEAIATVHLKTV